MGERRDVRKTGEDSGREEGREEGGGGRRGRKEGRERGLKRKKGLREFHSGEKKPVKSKAGIVRPVLASFPSVSWINLGPQPQLSEATAQAPVSMEGFLCAYLLPPRS